MKALKASLRAGIRPERPELVDPTRVEKGFRGMTGMGARIDLAAVLAAFAMIGAVVIGVF
jgi:hypothetical protein